MPTLCSAVTRWDGQRRPVEWCPLPADVDGERCEGHRLYEATDAGFEAHLRAEEAAA